MKPLSGAKAKAVELAVYNSYVPAQGLYSDTVAKLSFLRSQFNVGKTIHVNNYAFSLSQESGYLVYLDQKQDWSLTPSYELGLGYINKSDFNYINKSDFNYINNSSDKAYGVTQHKVKKAASTVLRNRVGVTLDYRFNPEYLDRAYFSVFYENDSYFGGKTRIYTQNEKLGVNANVSQKVLRNDGRAVLNFGINSTLNKNVGLYLDAQKSFDGKINTDFQLNGSLRFSF
ncbi:autotransporter outer membrane beta-barrel domain-containing protein [Mergibacter septicus]|uniref:autotransporter outer membrane beta-barrel domain-containing protein n=1 Tax=Mergibacter septicus TaxID=221402 RepID=UPI00223F438B|nr:autotransporter outer membrane beta-barrel domain-containing protein [Mergibacter septicus]